MLALVLLYATLLVAAIAVSLLAVFWFLALDLLLVPLLLLPLAAVCLQRLSKDVTLLRFPKEFVQRDPSGKLSTSREHRPLLDVVFHVLVFKWGLLGDGRLFDTAMAQINSSFLSWDEPFSGGPDEAEQRVHGFCDQWGVSRLPWVWAKPAREYSTLNDWFCRSYSEEFRPETNLGVLAVVAPATAVVTWFESVEDMPKTLKNDKFTIDDCGFTNEFVLSCRSNPCTLHYLAPSDYHCYHSPVDGKVSYLNLLTQGRYSMTVKPYIFGSTNILRRNRRAVLVIDCGALKVGMIIIGGVTVDSIRLDELVKVGAVLRKGQRIGAFARGGSSIAMFFSGPVELDSWAADVVASGKDFKLNCGQDLASRS